MSTKPRVYGIVHDEGAKVEHIEKWVNDFDATIYTVPQSELSEERKQIIVVHYDDYQALEQKLAVAVEALEKLNKHLTIPAAEHVPAIPEAWTIIDKALALINPDAQKESEP